MKHLEDGKQAELLALGYLQRQGFKLVESNWWCKLGEIDLIMSDQRTLVFVEVRYRKQQRFGSALETITASKRKKVIATATLFLQTHSKWRQSPSRFDVISITNSIEEPVIEWLKDAFCASSYI